MSAEAGLTTPNIDEGATNTALIRSAARTVVLADHTKWDETGLSRFAALDEVAVLVTDSGLDGSAREAAEAVVGELVVAEVAPGTTETGGRARTTDDTEDAQ
ncbi:hypothetical protein GCM10025865_03420 [Paraoerskovia sediminicola]|uniref:DeoR-like transcriptional repressor C-terminal sensor domain-containing protein n=1 Tax=Paraoerskovia sediminicola TaxID=1138587 RepID=A0ABM8FZ55_9CELL|nr:hypothetical protein GCM10025865_03420 [Paraoerskovia sediminicola]